MNAAPVAFNPKDWTPKTVSRGDDGWTTAYHNANGESIDETAYAAQLEQWNKTAMAQEQERAAKGVPTWMDIYNKHKTATNNFNGKGLNSWQQDASHEALKQRIDAEYIANLDAYNKAKGTSFQPTEGVLGIQAQPNTDWHSARDNVDNKGGVLGAALGKDWLNNAAKAAVLVGTGYAMAPMFAGAAAGGAAAGGTAASGVAGALGMEAGWAATALNSGLMNTGLSLVSGKNIGESLKNGITSAALSGAGSWVGDAINTNFAELGKPIANTLANVGGGAATSGLAAAVRGRDIGEGIIRGAIGGGITSAADLVGGWAGEQTGSQLAGTVARGATNVALRGGDVRRGIIDSATGGLWKQAGLDKYGNYNTVKNFAKAAGIA